MPAEKTAPVMVRLTPEMYDELKQLAEEGERSVAQVIRLAIRTYLEQAKAS